MSKRTGGSRGFMSNTVPVSLREAYFVPHLREAPRLPEATGGERIVAEVEPAADVREVTARLRLAQGRISRKRVRAARRAS